MKLSFRITDKLFLIEWVIILKVKAYLQRKQRNEPDGPVVLHKYHPRLNYNSHISVKCAWRMASSTLTVNDKTLWRKNARQSPCLKDSLFVTQTLFPITSLPNRLAIRGKYELITT